MPEQQHYQGDDGWAKIADYLDAISASNILLVTGNSMYRASGAEQALEPVLRKRKVTHLTCFHANPRVEDVTQLLDQIDNKESYQAIIAVGGGSVIDVAKLLKAFWGNPPKLDEHLGSEDDRELPQLICRSSQYQALLALVARRQDLPLFTKTKKNIPLSMTELFRIFLWSFRHFWQACLSM